jgi:hypothetical protein
MGMAPALDVYANLQIIVPMTPEVMVSVADRRLLQLMLARFQPFPSIGCNPCAQINLLSISPTAHTLISRRSAFNSDNVRPDLAVHDSPSELLGERRATALSIAVRNLSYTA